jgi:hypothetical protein
MAAAGVDHTPMSRIKMSRQVESVVKAGGVF